jgi:hypothetical protein
VRTATAVRVAPRRRRAGLPRDLRPSALRRAYADLLAYGTVAASDDLWNHDGSVSRTWTDWLGRRAELDGLAVVPSGAGCALRAAGTPLAAARRRSNMELAGAFRPELEPLWVALDYEQLVLEGVVVGAFSLSASSETTRRWAELLIGRATADGLFAQLALLHRGRTEHPVVELLDPDGEQYPAPAGDTTLTTYQRVAGAELRSRVEADWDRVRWDAYHAVADELGDRLAYRGGSAQANRRTFVLGS